MTYLVVAAIVFCSGICGSAEHAQAAFLDAATPPAWLPEVEEILTADNFPTCDSAAAAIGNRLRQAIGRVLPLAHGMAVVPEAGPIPQGVLKTIRHSLEHEFPGEPVRLVAASAEVGTQEIGIYVTSDDGQQVLTASVQFPAGLKTDDGRVTLPYDHKAWVVSTAELAEHQRLVQSDRLANTPREAKQQCLDRAVDELAPVFTRHARNVSNGRSDLPFDPHAAIRGALANGDFTVDEFSQRLRTTDGTDAWRHAMLLNDEALNDLMIRQNLDVSRRRHQRDGRWLGRLGGLIVLLLCVSVVYLLLDTATQGYYAGRIKAVMAIFGIVGLALIILMTVG